MERILIYWRKIYIHESQPDSEKNRERDNSVTLVHSHLTEMESQISKSSSLKINALRCNVYSQAYVKERCT